MNRPNSLRIVVLAAVLLPALAILGVTWRADAQPGGLRNEKLWRCSKCGGNLGNGVTPPSTCPHCSVKIRKPAVDNWPDGPAVNTPRTRPADSASESSPIGKALAIAVAGLAIVVLGFLVMKEWHA